MAKEAYDFHKELELHGPWAKSAPLDLKESFEYCSWFTRVHYENFSVISWFLPKSLKPAFEAVYAFSRWSDDLGDEAGSPEKSLELLRWWAGELDESFANPSKSKHPILKALATEAKKYLLNKEPFERLIRAFEMDQTKNRFATRKEVLFYCHHSANPVGEIVLSLFKANTKDNIALSDSICTGLQLANFWQDVSRDLEINRIYIPKEDMDQIGVTESDLWTRKTNSAIRELIRKEVDWAEECFLKGNSLPDKLGGPMGEQIRLFLMGGQAILRKIRQTNFNSLEQRPKLSKWDKLSLAVPGLARMGAKQILSLMPFASQKRRLPK